MKFIYGFSLTVMLLAIALLFAYWPDMLIGAKATLILLIIACRIIMYVSKYIGK
jgi:hypothetical protein